MDQDPALTHFSPMWPLVIAYGYFGLSVLLHIATRLVCFPILAIDNGETSLLPEYNDH